MALICLITFANVLVRYFTDESFAFTEEFSVFLMVVLTFVGTSAAFAKNSHIRMSFVVEKLPQAHCPLRRDRGDGRRRGAVRDHRLVRHQAAADDWKFDTTSPGIGIPQWIYTLWLPLLCAVIVLRIVGRILRLARRKG